MNMGREMRRGLVSLAWTLVAYLLCRCGGAGSLATELVTAGVSVLALLLCR